MAQAAEHTHRGKPRHKQALGIGGDIARAGLPLTDETVDFATDCFGNLCRATNGSGVVEFDAQNCADAIRSGYELTIQDGQFNQNNTTPMLTNDSALTDSGNAKRFIAQYGQDVRHVYEWRRWFVFDGHHWRADDNGELTRMAQRSAITIYGDAGQANHPKTAQKIAGHARRSLSLKSIMAALELAKAETGITISQRTLDANPMLIGVQNGVIDLTTGRLRDGEREDFITKKLPIAYDPAATCPRWTRFVSEIMGGNSPLVDYLHRLCGYVLTGHVTEQIFAILHGIWGEWQKYVHGYAARSVWRRIRAHGRTGFAVSQSKQSAPDRAGRSARRAFSRIGRDRRRAALE